MINFDIFKKLNHFDLDVSFSFESGVLVIEGESGSGKTTLLNCLAGLNNADKGFFLVNNQVLFNSKEKINIPTRNRNIGYLFQQYALFPHLTVYENVTYGLTNKKEKDTTYADEIIASFHIEHLKNRYPRGISGGEKQRVALARSIVTKPDLLFLDEPFSALDTRTKNIVYQEFMDFKKNFNIPTILITHDQNERKIFADHAIYLKDGKITNPK